MIAVAARPLLKISLMFPVCWVKNVRLVNLCHDAVILILFNQAVFDKVVKSLNDFQGLKLLLEGLCEDGRGILRSNVIFLPVKGRWVVKSEEKFDEVF